MYGYTNTSAFKLISVLDIHKRTYVPCGYVHSHVHPTLRGLESRRGQYNDRACDDVARIILLQGMKVTYSSEQRCFCLINTENGTRIRHVLSRVVFSIASKTRTCCCSRRFPGRSSPSSPSSSRNSLYQDKQRHNVSPQQRPSSSHQRPRLA